MLTPTSKICLRSYHPRIFGPAIPTCGRSSAAVSKSFSACRSGAQSSCKIQSHSLHSPSAPISSSGSDATAAAIAEPKPASLFCSITLIPALRSNFGEPSIDPLSTAMISSSFNFWEESAATTSLSHVTPSWETMIAVTC